MEDILYIRRLLFGIDEKCSPFLSDNIINVIFIRHSYREDHLYDPGLSKFGIDRSLKLSDKLTNKIKDLWKDEPYVIASSNMIRTQETAYYMLAEKVNMPINIFPHIGEKGFSIDNIGYPRMKQREIINERNPKIIEFLDKGKDERGRQNFLNKSCWVDFINWTVKNLDLFECGSDGIYRAVIFTHSDFLRSQFKLPNEERGGLNSVFNTEFKISDYNKTLDFTYYEL